MNCNRLVVSMTATLTLALRPSTVHAQLETFAPAGRGLAEASRQPEPSRSLGIHTAAERLGPALAEWDRRIAALKARSDGELAEAPPADHAYRLHIELGVAFRARGRLA